MHVIVIVIVQGFGIRRRSTGRQADYRYIILEWSVIQRSSIIIIIIIIPATSV